MKICLVGAGGIGSRIAGFMQGMLPKEDRLFVMDGDSFEEKNLERQVFSRDMIGINKAEAMSRMYSRFKPVPEFLLSTSQLRGFGAVVCVPDNNEARMIAIQYCLETNSLGVIAGNETTSANAYIVDSGLSMAFERTSPFVRYPELLEKNTEVRLGSCAEAAESNPQTALANSAAACMAMNLLLYWRNTAPELPRDIIMEFAPVEMVWTESRIHTLKTGDLK